MKFEFRPNALMRVDFPDDVLEEQGRIVRFPGLNIAQAIIEHLRALGYTVSEPEDMQEFGWDFEAESERRSVWFRVHTGFDEFVYFFTRSAITLPWIKKRHHAELLTRLNGALAQDARFLEVRWGFKREMETGALSAKEPVSS